VALRDARKITTLYTHQTSAMAALSNGKDVIVSTSTASGKSVIYQATSEIILFASVLIHAYFHKVPLLRMLEQDKETKALFIYPTKVSPYPPATTIGLNALSRLWLKTKGQRLNNC
jgi:DEAD/DEAH box helicase domain-containing protein